MNSSRTDWFKSQIPTLRKWRSLTAGEYAFLAMSLVLLPPVVVALRLVGYRRTRAMLRWTSPSNTIPGFSISTAQRYGRLANIAANHALLPANCLPRSLFLWWILRWIGCESSVCFGATRKGAQLFAHAWVECQGVPVNDAQDVSDRYLPFLPTRGVISKQDGEWNL